MSYFSGGHIVSSFRLVIIVGESSYCWIMLWDLWIRDCYRCLFAPQALSTAEEVNTGRHLAQSHVAGKRQVQWSEVLDSSFRTFQASTCGSRHEPWKSRAESPWARGWGAQAEAFPSLTEPPMLPCLWPLLFLSVTGRYKFTLMLTWMQNRIHLGSTSPTPCGGKTQFPGCTQQQQASFFTAYFRRTLEVSEKRAPALCKGWVL